MNSCSRTIHYANGISYGWKEERKLTKTITQHPPLQPLLRTERHVPSPRPNGLNPSNLVLTIVLINFASKISMSVHLRRCCTTNEPCPPHIDPMSQPPCPIYPFKLFQPSVYHSHHPWTEESTKVRGALHASPPLARTRSPFASKHCLIKDLEQDTITIAQ
jgi:hypothetical protein